MAGLSPEEIYELQEAFSLYDKDEIGSIQTSDFKKVLGALGIVPNQSELQMLISRFGLNGSETMVLDKFLEAVSYYKMNCCIVEAEDEACSGDNEELFRLFDKNGDGYITKPELRHGMTVLGERLTDSELDDMFKAADIDGDGRIDYKEFQRMMSQC